MSIIQDALKKAQEDRKKKNSREVPYHLSGVQKKPKTVVYISAGLFCIVVVLAYLYVPYFHKPKQITPSVVIQTPVPAKPAQAVAVEKSIAFVTTKDKREPVGVKFRGAQIRKIAISPPAERDATIAEPTGKQDTTNEPVRVIEKKTDSGSVDSMYNEASREQQTGSTREAKTIYKQILAKQPDHIETLNNLGVIAIYEGNTQEALFYFRRILEYRKNYSKAYNNIGLIAMKDGDRQLAEEYLRKAISLEPDDPGPYVNLSALFRTQGRLQEAAKLLEVPIQKKAKDPDLFLSYAVIKDNLGQYEDAARFYRQYLSLIQNPASRKDIIERLQYIEDKRQ